jgi:urease accessory protein
MLLLTQRLSDNPELNTLFVLSLTAEERTRSRHRFRSDEGEPLELQLPRGTVLHDGDLLGAASGDVWVRVKAKPEPVLTVTAATPLALLKAAYHLGNRHVPLEVTSTYLRLSPDSVLEQLLGKLGVTVLAEVVPFQPEVGAYSHSHS